MRETVAILSIAVTLAATIGCTSRKCGSCCPSGVPRVSKEAGWESRAADHEIDLVGHVDLLAFRGPDHENVSAARDSWTYRSLDAETCQCQATARSPEANLLDSQSRALHSGEPEARFGRAEAMDLEADLLAYRAVHARNSAAAAALELYYSLAEAEANRGFLEQTALEITSALNDLEDSREAGFMVEDDYVDMLRRRNATIAQQAALQPIIHELNGTLHRLLGVDWDGSTMIWPSIEMNVDARAVDIPAALDTAMALRADLAVFDVARKRVTESNLVAVSQLMRAQNVSSSSLAGHSRRLLHANDRARTLDTTRRQLDILRTAQYRAVRNEIRTAAARRDAASTRLALARATLRTWNRTIDDLQDKRDTANATTADLFAARMNRIEAEREAMQGITAYRIAEMKLKQAQGLLAFRCGHGTSRCGAGPAALSAQR